MESSSARPGLLVEGWRSLPHSYAIVNGWQLLSLSLLGEVDLHHRDVPYFRASWRPVSGLFDGEREARIAAVPGPPAGLAPDAVLRVAFPYDLRPVSAGGGTRLGVFGTAEHGHVGDDKLVGGRLADRRDDLQLITPSRWSREGFLRGGADPARVHVVPHGVEPGVFHPLSEGARAALRREMGWDGFVFLSIGAMTPNKGLDLLLRGFAQVAAAVPDVRLVLKGMDSLYPSRDLLLSGCGRLSAAEAGLLQPRLLYLSEPLSFAEMARLYQAADAYVCPYLAEGFNLPALEATACGLPVICTAGGPTDDFVDEGCSLPVRSRVESFAPALGVQGLCLRPDIEHLIHQMRTAVTSADLAGRARIAGPARVAASFTWDHAARGLLRVLFPGA